MANLGVNLNEVWQQPSILQERAPVKHSRYTVPIDPNQMVREGFESSRNAPPYQNMPVAEGGLPISQPPSSPPTSYQSSEIPQLKEQLTQQIDAMTGCQKEVNYLKALVHTLKSELQESVQRIQYHQKLEKKRKTADLIWMAVVGIFLIIIVILLAQMMQKVNRLLSQPLMFNA